MKSLEKRLLTAVFAVFIPIAVQAGPSESKEAERLGDAKGRLRAAANATKGYPRARLDMQRRKVEELIEALEAGKRVDPTEIDEALNQTNELAR